MCIISRTVVPWLAGTVNHGARFGWTERNNDDAIRNDTFEGMLKAER